MHIYIYMYICMYIYVGMCVYDEEAHDEPMEEAQSVRVGSEYMYIICTHTFVCPFYLSVCLSMPLSLSLSLSNSLTPSLPLYLHACGIDVGL